MNCRGGFSRLTPPASAASFLSVIGKNNSLLLTNALLLRRVADGC